MREIFKRPNGIRLSFDYDIKWSTNKDMAFDRVPDHKLLTCRHIYELHLNANGTTSCYSPVNKFSVTLTHLWVQSFGFIEPKPRTDDDQNIINSRAFCGLFRCVTWETGPNVSD